MLLQPVPINDYTFFCFTIFNLKLWLNIVYIIFNFTSYFIKI